MTWAQIKEIEAEEFVFIGHHSHTHGYLIDETNDQFVKDIEQANKIFLDKLDYIPSVQKNFFCAEIFVGELCLI